MAKKATFAKIEVYGLFGEDDTWSFSPGRLSNVVNLLAVVVIGCGSILNGDQNVTTWFRLLPLHSVMVTSLMKYFKTVL